MPQAKGRRAQPSGQAGWSSRRAAHQPLLSEAFGELECRVVPEQADQYEPADDEREQLERLAQQYLHTQASPRHTVREGDSPSLSSALMCPLPCCGMGHTVR